VPDTRGTSAGWGRSAETPEEAGERLATQGAARVQAARAGAAAAYYAQFDFRPRLCARSLQLARQARAPQAI